MIKKTEKELLLIKMAESWKEFGKMMNLLVKSIKSNLLKQKTKLFKKIILMIQILIMYKMKEK